MIRACEPMKQRVRLFHWNEAESKKRAEILRAAGYEVFYKIQHGPEFLRDVRTKPPTAFVIDLSRLPSHGRSG